MSAERANGPYKHGRNYRVGRYQGSRFLGYRIFKESEYPDPERAAQAYVDSFKEITDNRTIGQVVAVYLDHLARFGGPRKHNQPLRQSTITRARYHLESLFQLRVTDRPLTSLTPAAARRYYAELVARGAATDTHRGSLVTATQFGNWVVKEKGWLKSNPFGDVRPEGERKQGKDVLKVDHARLFVAAALRDHTESELACHRESGLAAWLLLALGLRISELTDRKVGDVNVNPPLLAVPKGKTRAAKRTLAIPAPLSSFVLKHIEGKAPDAQLFQFTRYGLYHHVKRICRVAGVPTVCPHGLRGSAATAIVSTSLGEVGGSDAASGVDAAARLLGHSNRAVTLGHYIAPGAAESVDAEVKARLIGINLGLSAENPIPTDEKGEEPFWKLLEV